MYPSTRSKKRPALTERTKDESGSFSLITAAKIIHDVSARKQRRRKCAYDVGKGTIVGVRMKRPKKEKILFMDG